jgi:murein DD-endopeptidase MepM/ murein hydrolase activator NlpD
VDPLARDDGETEPEVELAQSGAPSSESPTASDPLDEMLQPTEKEPQSPPEVIREPEPGPEPEVDPDMHPVRARLLARAREVRPQSIHIEPTPRTAPIRTGGPPSAPELRPLAPAPLSPTWIAAFGALLGLAAVASIIALAMRFDGSHANDAPVTETKAPTPTNETVVEKPKRIKLPGPWRIEDERENKGVRIVSGKIGTKSFLSAVVDAGLEKEQAYRAFNALKDLKNLDRCEREDSFFAMVDRTSSRLTAFEYVVSKEEVYQAKDDANGALKGQKLDFKIERNQVKVGLVYQGGDFDSSAEKAGLERGLGKVVAKALDGHSSIDELKKGDVLRLVVQEVTVLGEFSRYSGVEAIEIRPASGEAERFYYFRGAKERGYYDGKGKSPYEGGWRKPVKDAPITSHFNLKRLHPILKKVMPHNGTDFGAPSGTPVGASSYGTVSFIGPAGPSGNLVKIEHPGDIETGYAHLSKFGEGLKVGDKVKRLQLIGYVGSTGRSTAPHLHFTAKRKGEFIDPETLNLDGMRVIMREEREAFSKVKTDYDALLDAVAIPVSAPEPVAAVDTKSAPDEGLGTGGGEEPPAATANAPPSKAPPEPATPPTPATPAAPAGGGRSPVFLSDKELQKTQAGSDDGEVDE